jgi:hypothetical protein
MDTKGREEAIRLPPINLRPMDKTLGLTTQPEQKGRDKKHHFSFLSRKKMGVFLPLPLMLNL